MNFKEIIKQEWEAEFPEAAALCTYENSLVTIYEQMVEKVCIKVWNSALELAADAAETEHSFEQVEDFPDAEFVVFVNKDSILKLKINEQRTDTTEV